jgi:hypothetical protein
VVLGPHAVSRRDLNCQQPTPPSLRVCHLHNFDYCCPVWQSLPVFASLCSVFAHSILSPTIKGGVGCSSSRTGPKISTLDHVSRHHLVRVSVSGGQGRHRQTPAGRLGLPDSVSPNRSFALHLHTDRPSIQGQHPSHLRLSALRWAAFSSIHHIVSTWFTSNTNQH